MGQRHQLFVIAKINGRYRTLCAIHHQWLYGRTALRRCLGALKIFEKPANRIPLQQELIAAQRQDEGFWTAIGKEYYKKNSHVPFPFIATCLITAASFDPEEGYYHRVSVEPFYMAYDEGDNNNAVSSGITIFDITEPSRVRYCFVDFQGMESKGPVQLMTPLTARIYLEAYYDLSDPKHSEPSTPLLNELNAWDVIPVATLRDAWPKGEWEEPESDQAGTDEAVVPELEKLEISTPDTSTSLRDRAMATVLQSLLDEPDESTGLLSEGELLTDFLPKLKEKLYEQSNVLKPSPHVFDLLYSALKGDADVDLSPFTNFSTENLSLVVSRLRKHGKMQTLCISNRPDLTAEDLQVVLRNAASLKALYIVEDPQIPWQGMSPLLKNCDLYASDLQRQAIKPEPVRFRSDPGSPVVDAAVPVGRVCGNNDISQLVWIGVSDQQALDKDHRLENGLIDWKTLQEEKRRTNFGWSRSGLWYKRYPLDIPLSIFRTVAGLLCLFEWGSASHIYEIEDFGKGAALSFALASSIHGDKELAIGPAGVGSGCGMGPLAAGLFRDSSYEPGPPDDVHERLEPGRWAVVLIHEAYNASSQKFLDKCQRNGPAGADSDSEDDNPLGQPKGGEQSFGGMMALLLGPRDPFENKAKNQGLPFRAIKRLRYALVTPCTEPQASGHDFIVADIPTYLEHTMGKIQDKGSDGDLEKLVEAYNSRITAMDTVGFYEDEDIHDLLPKVFPKQKAASSGSKPQ